MDIEKDVYLQNMGNRTSLALGQAALEILANKRVIVFGLGGVGSWCAEALIRSGIMHMTLVDADIICATNINRQAQATSSNIGLVKVEEMKKRLLDINPYADISAINQAYTSETAEVFNMETYDYVVDAIDSLAYKCHLISECLEKEIPFISSMGAASRTDPGRIHISKLSKTHTCTLARAVRQRLRKMGVSTEFPCVYSDEPPLEPAEIALCHSGGCVCRHDRSAAETEGLVDWCAMKKQINGSLVHITAIFGFHLASAIIRDATGIFSLQKIS